MEEDESAGPQSDSRQALAKFNKQMEILFKFLQAVEHIKLDPSVLDPEPVEIADEKDGKIKVQAVSKGMPEGKYSLINRRQLHIFSIKPRLDMRLFIDFCDFLSTKGRKNNFFLRVTNVPLRVFLTQA